MHGDIIDSIGMPISEPNKRMIRSLEASLALKVGKPSITFEEIFVEAKRLVLGPANFTLTALGRAEWDCQVFMGCADIPEYLFEAYDRLKKEGLIAAG